MPIIGSIDRVSESALLRHFYQLSINLKLFSGRNAIDIKSNTVYIGIVCVVGTFGDTGRVRVVHGARGARGCGRQHVLLLLCRLSLPANTGYCCPGLDGAVATWAFPGISAQAN